MWFALIATALANPRLISVTESVELEGPVLLAWTKLATSDGVATIGGTETDPRDPKLVLDERGERAPAMAQGRPGEWVVVSIDGPRMIKLRWEPTDPRAEEFLDVALVERGEGTVVEATLAYPASSGQQKKKKKEASRALMQGLEDFRVSVDGEAAER